MRIFKQLVCTLYMAYPNTHLWIQSYTGYENYIISTHIFLVYYLKIHKHSNLALIDCFLLKYTCHIPVIILISPNRCSAFLLFHLFW